MEIINFDKIDHLALGNIRQKAAYTILHQHKIMELLALYQPLLVGTIPIGVDIDGSDLDIICNYSNAANFENALKDAFSRYPNFQVKQKIIAGSEAILCNFNINNWPIEIFGAQLATKLQKAYLHMVVEYQLLQQYGETLRQQVVELKKQGIKTEQAFAIALGIKGDPYVELLSYPL